MAIGKSIRIYDLAKEVKQDTKRVMEDLRREGADVSVPSNSVTKEFAEKIRNKYFPKVDAAPKRTIKGIKRKAEPEVEAPAEVEAAQPEAEAPAVEAPAAAEPAPKVVKKVEEEPKKEPSKVKVLTKKV